MEGHAAAADFAPLPISPIPRVIKIEELHFKADGGDSAI